VNDTAPTPQVARLPTVLRWQEPDNPLPVRPIRLPGRSVRRTLGLEAPAWLHTGAADRPFDFCGCVRLLCADLCRFSPEPGYIDVGRLPVAVTQALICRTHGLHARVTPLRFRHGQLTRRRRDGDYQVQRYVVGGCEMLYLVTFCLPRFLDQDFDDKF